MQIRRVNDRVNKPVPSTLWSDIMFNFTMRDDTNRHVCEVQIVHKMMADVSEALSQHDDYDVVRVAAGILRARNVDMNQPPPPQSSGDGIETEDESKGGGGSSPAVELELPQHDPRLRQALDRLSELEEALRPRMGELGRYPAPVHLCLRASRCATVRRCASACAVWCRRATSSGSSPGAHILRHRPSQGPPWWQLH